MGLGISLSIVTVSMFVIAIVNRERYLQEKEEVKRLKAQLHRRNIEEMQQRKIQEVINLHGQV